MTLRPDYSTPVKKRPIALDLVGSHLALTKYELSGGSYEPKSRQADALLRVSRYLGGAFEALQIDVMQALTEESPSPELERLMYVYLNLEDPKAPGLVSRAAGEMGVTVTQIGEYASTLESMARGERPQVEDMEEVGLFILGLLGTVNEQPQYKR